MEIIRKRPPNIQGEALTPLSLDLGALAKKLGIEIVSDSSQEVMLTMPVNTNTQPSGILHGGATATLAETAASWAANSYATPLTKTAVGLELNITYLSIPKTELIIAICRPLHLGKSTTVHDIEIRDSDQKLIAKARVTNYLIDKK